MADDDYRDARGHVLLAIADHCLTHCRVEKFRSNILPRTRQDWHRACLWLLLRCFFDPGATFSSQSLDALRPTIKSVFVTSECLFDVKTAHFALAVSRN